MIPFIYPVWIPLSAFSRDIVFLIQGINKSRIIQWIGAIFFMFFPETIRIFHAQKLA